MTSSRNDLLLAAGVGFCAITFVGGRLLHWRQRALDAEGFLALSASHSSAHGPSNSRASRSLGTIVNRATAEAAVLIEPPVPVPVPVPMPGHVHAPVSTSTAAAATAAAAASTPSPPPPPSPPPAVQRIAARLAKSRPNRRQRKRREPLFRGSTFPDATPHACKGEINRRFAELVRELHGADPAAWGGVLLILDAPSYRTTRAVAEVVGLDLASLGGVVVVPQYDLVHYVRMINDPDVYTHVRLQRLDHWLCANAGKAGKGSVGNVGNVGNVGERRRWSEDEGGGGQENRGGDAGSSGRERGRGGNSGGCGGSSAGGSGGIQVCGWYGDYETSFVGHKEKRLSPAEDVRRIFRFGYLTPQCVLALTWNLHNGGEPVDDVVSFIEYEAAMNGYEATLVQSWSYGLGCVLFTCRRRRGGGPGGNEGGNEGEEENS